jgi:hypothetical protein
MKTPFLHYADSLSEPEIELLKEKKYNTSRIKF